MKNFFTLFIIVLLAVFNANAEPISGKVVDADNQPVEFATVVLQTTDSVYVNSAYTDSLGMFSFDSNEKTFRLIVQHLLFETYDKLFAQNNAGIIQLGGKSHSLNEVVVKGERPLVRVVDGRMTYDMPQLLQGKVVSNAYESLLQLPGVQEQEGALSLAGASALTVILNGKPTTMTRDQLNELLKNTPADRIEKAEVMYSAPPQFHVRGAAINLVLKGGFSETPNLQGQVNGSYSQYHYADFSTGTTLMYSTPKFSTDFMYSFKYLGHRNGLNIDSKHLYNGSIYDIEQHNRGNYRTGKHNIRLGNDYQINNSNKISLVYTGEITPWQRSEEYSKGTFSDSKNNKDSDIPTQMHNVALSYKSGFGLDAGMDYTFYKNHDTQDYAELMPGKEDSFEAQSKQNVNRLSVYADQSQKLTSGWTLNYGAQFMYAKDASSQKYKSLTGKDLSGSDSESNLKEYTYDFYAGFEKSFSEKLSATFSLTGEYYNRNNYDEWSLFPALQTTYVASPSHIWQLSVSSDKSYPGYWAMANSVSYLNGYTEIHGNPDLRPYKDYSMQLTHILKSKYVFTAFFNYEDDYSVQLPYQLSDRLAMVYKVINFDYNKKIGVNVVIPFSLGSILNSRFVTSGFYHRVKSSHFHDTSFDKDNFAWYVDLNNTINISSKPNIKMEVAGTYITKNIQGPSKISPMYKIDAGIKWLFANNNAELRFKANDIFNSWSPDNWSMHLDNQNLNMHITPDSRYVSVSFTYKFGGYKDKKRKEVDTSRFGK